jgi:hypothetical protein
MKLYSVGQTEHNFLLNNYTSNSVWYDTVHTLPQGILYFLHITQFGGVSKYNFTNTCNKNMASMFQLSSNS